MRTRRTIRRHLRNFTVILLMILAFCSGFFGHTLLNARAEEKARPEWNRYYTSVQIRQLNFCQLSATFNASLTAL